MNKPGRSYYGSVEDYRSLRFSSARRPVIYDQHQMLHRQPKLDESCVRQSTKQRARCALGVAIVLGLMLGGYALGSNVASARGGASPDLAAASESHVEVGCVLNVRNKALEILAADLVSTTAARVTVREGTCYSTTVVQ